AEWYWVDGAGGGGARRELLPISRNIMFRDARNLLPGGLNVKFRGTACTIMLDEPLLSAQAPRRAPRPDPAADHRGRDRAAPDDRAGRHHRERDRRACPGRKGDRLPPLRRRADARPRLQRPVLRAAPLPRPRAL